MTLQEQIKKDLTLAMKAKDEFKKNTLRVILGEFGRLESKTFTDDEGIRVLKKLISSEKETLEKQGKDSLHSPYIHIIESYLPQMASEEDIKTWIKENVDFSQFKNKMQAMKTIMMHFGSTADGNVVKKILQDM
jgi:uncharacterized protein YqeY